MEKLVLSGKKEIIYSPETDTLKFLFFSDRYFDFPVFPIKYLIEIWRENPHFHIACDIKSRLFYKLDMITRHRIPGNYITGPDGYPVYHLRVLSNCPYKAEDQNNSYLAENPIFYYKEWHDFCTWMDSLNIAEYEKDQFLHLFDYAHLFSDDNRSTNIGV